MPLFCIYCNNLLEKVSTASEFYFNCVKCVQKYDIEEDDVIQFEENSSNNLNMAQILLLHAADDPVNPKIEKKCSKCNHGYARQIRVGKDMRLIDTCIGCKHQEIH